MEYVYAIELGILVVLLWVVAVRLWNIGYTMNENLRVVLQDLHFLREIRQNEIAAANAKALWKAGLEAEADILAERRAPDPPPLS